MAAKVSTVGELFGHLRCFKAHSELDKTLSERKKVRTLDGQVLEKEYTLLQTPN